MKSGFSQPMLTVCLAAACVCTATMVTVYVIRTRTLDATPSQPAPPGLPYVANPKVPTPTPGTNPTDTRPATPPASQPVPTPPGNLPSSTDVPTPPTSDAAPAGNGG